MLWVRVPPLLPHWIERRNDKDDVEKFYSVSPRDAAGGPQGDLADAEGDRDDDDRRFHHDLYHVDDFAGGGWRHFGGC